MELFYSFIIPVYNRPGEILELLNSFSEMATDILYEIVIVEDGSTLSAKDVIKGFNGLNISYYTKENSGPGDSRNYGMHRAKGNYFIILDSDVILPPDYLNTVDTALREDYVHCFGGSDTAHPTFSNLQKAINYSMTSFLTTGGIRGKKRSMKQFEPRSFNMGLSREAFEATNGFGKIHPGEDPDLVMRLWQMGYKTRLVYNAYVFHKRRISWSKFYKQVANFGGVRPILNSRFPESRKIVFWLPSLFLVGLIFSILFLLIFNLIFFLGMYIFYALLLFLHATYKSSNPLIGAQAVVAAFLQFIAYGYSFLISTVRIAFNNKPHSELFPKYFFK